MSKFAEAKKGNYQDNDWGRKVVPKFIDRFLTNSGTWQDTLDMFPGSANFTFPLSENICAVKMASRHIKDDLQQTLNMEGCGTLNDSNSVFDQIKACQKQEGADAPFSDKIVEFLRNQVRANCCKIRGDC
ncbi:MAG: hypothetical protein ACRERU_22195 [Methylococcales bacterium]